LALQGDKTKPGKHFAVGYDIRRWEVASKRRPGSVDIFNCH